MNQGTGSLTKKYRYGPYYGGMFIGGGCRDQFEIGS
jgi:hypothetical protein